MSNGRLGIVLIYRVLISFTVKLCLISKTRINYGI